MPTVQKETLETLSKNTQNLRNLCIIAHVDHGKTTFSDSLLATNGIISTKVAGKVRYLDSREDEQERGITMKSSAVALYFKLISLIRSAGDGSQTKVENEYLIHLIDSPGHVDFSGEVSVASRLCDGALVLVDVVEGVCTQTHVVLRQAWNEHVRPILVLNKIDRLILELKMSTAETYDYLYNIIEQVNSVMSSFAVESEVLLQNRLHDLSMADIASSVPSSQPEISREAPRFDPVAGNVIFASAIDGWAFRLSDFLPLYAPKLKVTEKELLKGLWGQYAYSSKEQAIVVRNDGRLAKNLFSQLILDNIWAVYDATQLNYNIDKIEKISQSLNVRLSPYDMRSKDTKGLARTLMSQWLPLSRAALLSVINYLPDPIVSQQSKFNSFRRESLVQFPNENLFSSCLNCRTDGETVAFVAKMISVEISNLSDYKVLAKANETDKGSNDDDTAHHEQELLIGFGRVYAGTLRKGQKIFVLGPRYDPSKPDEYCSEVTIEGLYLIVGRSYEEVSEVAAGNVIGIRGLHDDVLKWGTLSSTKECPSLGFTDSQYKNTVVRVAIESKDPSKMPQLVEGLRLLNQADPAVEVMVQESGEHVLLTSGELHLERCVRDLKERFAKIDIHVSAPIVPFRETISKKLNKVDDSVLEVSSQNVAIKVRCVAMSPATIRFLTANNERMKRIVENPDKRAAAGFISELQATNKSLDCSRIWSFGPKRVGCNILINAVPGYDRAPWGSHDRASSPTGHPLQELDSGIISGFQLATAAGPLCAEPLHGLVFIVEDLQINSDSQTQLSGQIITIFKDSCKQAMLKWSPRLMLAMYSCEIQATGEVLGKVYAVLAKRMGKIIAEEMKEGTDLFTVKANLPVVESFGFADEIRKRTSGAAQPQLIFVGWELLDEDPFWQPTTEEELEDYGDKADRESISKRYMDNVRKRKGLFVEKKLIEHAEKQRTLKIK